MAHKEFDAARREARPDDDPVSFGLGGEKFFIPQPVPVLPIMDLAAIDPDTGGKEAMLAFRDCLLGVLDPADHARFRKAAVAARADSDMLGQIAQYVIAETTGRPTARRSSSDESPSLTGDSSNGGSPEPPADNPS